MSIEEQVRASTHLLSDGSDFADHIWLTFYLVGESEKLRELTGALNKEGWSNLEGCEGGFVYAKIATDKSEEMILALALSTQILCKEAGVEILNIDADTSPNVEESRFVTLYRV